MSLPNRIFVCGACGYNTPYRWRLRDHLYAVHDLAKCDAYEEAYNSEYHLTLNPAPRYINPFEDE